MGYATDYETGNTYWVDDDDPRKVYTVDGQPVSEAAKYDAAQMSLPFSQRTPYTATKSQAGTATYDTNQALYDRIAELENQIKQLTNQKASQLLLEQGAKGTIGEDEWSDIVPVAAFSKAFGIPAMGMTPVQEWRAQQAAPTYATYLASSFLNPTSNPLNWGSYISNYGYQGAKSSAADLFRKALNMSSDMGGQAGFIDILGDYFDNFMRYVLGNFYAAPIAQKLASKIPALQNQYTAETKGQGSSFLDYLKDKYNLSGLI